MIPIAWRGARGLRTALAGAILGAAAPAGAEVWVYEHDTRALAGIGSVPDPSYLLSSDDSGEDSWWTPTASDPVSLSNAATVAAQAEAIFLHPYDQVPIAPPFTADTTGGISYSAAHGRLAAALNAQASTFPASYVAVSSQPGQGPIAIDNPYLAGSFAGVWLAYADELTVTSATLPVGTPVEVVVAVALDGGVVSSGTLGGGPPYPNQAYAETELDLDVYDPGYQVLRTSREAQLRTEIIAGEVVRSDPRRQAWRLEVRVGDHLSVHQALRAYARATASPVFADAASASSSVATLSLRPLTGGVSITADSGEVYPVPEPARALLQAAGLLALLGLCRLRRAPRAATAGAGVARRGRGAAPSAPRGRLDERDGVAVAHRRAGAAPVVDQHPVHGDRRHARELLVAARVRREALPGEPEHVGDRRRAVEREARRAELLRHRVGELHEDGHRAA